MAVCHENSNSMFTTRPSPTSFNFPPFGYPTQASGYGQEYGQYPTMPDAPYQQPPWAGMYGTASRPVSSGLEEWTPNYMVPTSSMQQAYNYSYRVPMSSSMGLDYSMNGSATPTSSSGDDSPNGSGSSISKTLRAPYDWMKSASMTQIPANGKTRTKDKYRNVYTDHQRLELEKEFHYSKFITIRRKTELSAKLNLSQRQVKIWFQNRRAKERKQNKKEKKVEGNVDLDLEDSLSPPIVDSNNHINNSHSSNSDQENIQPQYQQHHHHQPQYPHSISPLSSDNLPSPPGTISETMYKNAHPQHVPQVKQELSAMDLNSFYTRYIPYAS